MQFGDTVIESLEATHPLYDGQSKSWEIMQDCFDGELAVKAKGIEYLPPLYGMDQSSYGVYKERAYFYGATNRTVEGLAGQLVNNDPSLHQDENMSGDEVVVDFYNGLASDNSSFLELLKRISIEFVLKGRVGLFVDGEKDGDKFNPKILRYRAEDIINWDYDRMAEGLPWKLRWVVLKENRFVPSDDIPWDRVETEQWRVLWLDEMGEYNHAVYRKMEDNDKETRLAYAPPDRKKKTQKYEMVPGSHVKPSKSGRYMDTIPFWVLNHGGDSGSFNTPPLLELALMNLSHYRSVATIENARFYAGAPTVVLTGVGNQIGAGNIQLGTGKAINLEEDASVNFLELSGTALASLEKALEEKEIKMAILGSRMMQPEPDKGHKESSVTHKIRRKGEMSVLASMADIISHKMTELVRFSAEWGMRKNPVAYRVLLNKEFSTLTPDSGLLVTLSKLVGMKLMSFETWYDVLKKMEMLPPGSSLQDELQKIKNGMGSDIIADMIALEHAPKVEEIDVTRNAGNLNGQ